MKQGMFHIYILFYSIKHRECEGEGLYLFSYPVCFDIYRNMSNIWTAKNLLAWFNAEEHFTAL